MESRASWRIASQVSSSNCTRLPGIEPDLGWHPLPQVLARDRRQVLEQRGGEVLLLADEALAHAFQVGERQLLRRAEHRPVAADLELLPAMGGDQLLRQV